ncbi:uncharacterized protein LOC114522575 [Dendronephthya gigantea]|uniref:uncharacterized protein LOC114522575 n=1 Tax=Dendronephthya gigantea TaxID=151771 RepID=UPI001069EE33|nr:uncharacterized protein LOC114522575 [Dendronephthya gigantea]
MFSIVSTFIFISIGFKATLAAKNGYVVVDITETTPPCKDASKIIPSNDTCAGIVTYKMADFTGFPNAPDLSYIHGVIPTINETLTMVGANATCRDAYKKYFCQLGYPFHCDEDSIGANVDELTATCEDVGEECPASLHINCSDVANNPGLTQRFPRKAKCVPFPELKNDPYSCETNYKVYSSDAAPVQKAAEMIVAQHNIVKNANLPDAECENKVADAVCKAFLLACSHDRTKIVALLSKQECFKNVRCVESANNTILTNKTMELCQAFPDENTAKNISIKDILIATSPTTNTNTVSGTMNVNTISRTMPNVNTTSRTMNVNMTTKAPCCGTASLSSMGHIFIVTLLLVSLAS